VASGFSGALSVILLPWSSLVALFRISVKMSWFDPPEINFFSDLFEAMADSFRVLLRRF
jgi:hypothetical protein